MSSYRAFVPATLELEIDTTLTPEELIDALFTDCSDNKTRLYYVLTRTRGLTVNGRIIVEKRDDDLLRKKP